VAATKKKARLSEDADTAKLRRASAHRPGARNEGGKKTRVAGNTAVGKAGLEQKKALKTQEKRAWEEGQGSGESIRNLQQLKNLGGGGIIFIRRGTEKVALGRIGPKIGGKRETGRLNA